MPYLNLQTNASLSPGQAPQLLKQLSNLVAKETGKPERYVMVSIQENVHMLFSGTAQPLAYLECKSIGMTAVQAKAISAAVAQLLTNTLHVPSERIYIEFSHCPADFWGWNGDTFG